MARVGIKDIAEKAGVSIATVSHAFRNPGRVSKKTRKRVLEAAEEIGYTPNKLAASLRTARTGNIVAIIPDVGDNFVSGIVKGIDSIANSRGYAVLLGETQGLVEKEREFAAMPLSRQADGIILMSHRLPFDMPDGASGPESLPPIISGCEATGHDWLPCVSIDDEQGGRDATNHLIKLGHRKIAAITGDRTSASTRKRLAGFHSAMADAGLTVRDSWVIYGGYKADVGELAAHELLLQKDRPTAVFCFSDEIALGCMHSLRHAGFGVPEDISVIGFDDIPFARYFTPSLTTIAQPAEAIGRSCAMLLFDLIDGQRPKTNRIILPHTLVVRESTRAIS
jgi:LacI family transcriptional regulator, repressor for deo operon, udp, cdd, tsx, nupC, and nupG